MYKIQDAITGKIMLETMTLLASFETLDHYTGKAQPVVITKGGEIVAGNTLGYKATVERKIFSI